MAGKSVRLLDRGKVRAALVISVVALVIEALTFTLGCYSGDYSGMLVVPFMIVFFGVIAALVWAVDWIDKGR
jgi:hypothetical protein